MFNLHGQSMSFSNYVHKSQTLKNSNLYLKQYTSIKTRNNMNISDSFSDEPNGLDTLDLVDLDTYLLDKKDNNGNSSKSISSIDSADNMRQGSPEPVQQTAPVSLHLSI